MILIFFGLDPVYSQHNYQIDFPPEEFKSRWDGVFEKIGDNGIAIIQGFPQPNGYIMPRQTNAFYYLSGIETPHSYLVLDGRSKQVTLYMPPANKKLEKSEGKVLSSNDGPLIKKLVGVDQVKSTGDMKNNFPPNLKRSDILYTMFPQQRVKVKVAMNLKLLMHLSLKIIGMDVQVEKVDWWSYCAIAILEMKLEI